ncbi:DNA-binding response regulator, OmpR family, contains REC and winged-helix (wHTH) domain [Lachnospiraceae bacterium C10]|jgi:DNA-binding response OmpR family regulator|nr:response regulator transcription factor [Lachnospiraceae bacterium]SCW47963.1 DNA-binding response regulator, OmpR family, contains REC and winged-helix (wHTH) domain [Lachnospiraceae bacterium C10]SDW36035.1 DNA-binding response regulator, OmpR family, contains REC and winged-helix (wHTH) domain [Lachnospiraceae bacterium KHCPX20]
MKLLIVEDEFALADALRDRLQQEKYEVDIAEDGITGHERAMSDTYDLIIMDGMLPGMDGVNIIWEMRKAGHKTPVIMLTARAGLTDRVKGLDAGADDYLTKPFEVEELLARIRALIRRNHGPEDNLLEVGNIQLDRKNGAIRNSQTGTDVTLSGKELKLLEYFMDNPGQVLSREQISLRIWGHQDTVEYNNVEVYVSFIRRKLKFLRANLQVKAVRGLGYRLVEDVSNG